MFECRVSDRKLNGLRILAGVLFCTIGTLTIVGKPFYAGARPLPFLVLISLALACDFELRRRFRFGIALGVSESHVVITRGRPAQAYALADIEKLIHRDELGYFLVHKDGYHIPLPYGRELDPAYRVLLTKVSHQLGEPESFRQ